jgi:uncharacterized membrane protein YkvA (DUF1232 family)
MRPPSSFETAAPRPPQDEGGGAGRLRRWAIAIKRDVVAVYLASRDPRVPWYAKAIAAAAAAYAVSPIDLIPDFIPVLGQLDDLVIVPLAVALAIRLIPPAIMAEHRHAAAEHKAWPDSFPAAATIICIWAAMTVGMSYLAYRAFSP